MGRTITLLVLLLSALAAVGWCVSSDGTRPTAAPARDGETPAERASDDPLEPRGAEPSHRTTTAAAGVDQQGPDISWSELGPGDGPFAVHCVLESDETGRPLAGLSIGLFRDGAPSPLAVARTNTAGEASLRTATPGSYHALPVGLLDVWAQPIPGRTPLLDGTPAGLAPRCDLSSRNPSAHLQLTLSRAATVTGTVAAEGTPRSGVLVSLRSEYDLSGRDVVTDARGRFRFDRFPKGRYLLACTLEDPPLADRYQAPAVREVALDAGASLEVGEIELLVRPTGSIVGLLVDEQGNPVVGLRVSCARPGSPASEILARCMSDETGRIELRGLPAEAVEVRFGARAPARQVVAGSRPIDLGRVVLPRSRR